MAGLFIDVVVDEKTASDAALVGKLVEVCPVNIFEQAESGAYKLHFLFFTWQFVYALYCGRDF